MRLDRELGEMLRVKIGNRGLSTAFTLKAIAALCSSTPQSQPQAQSERRLSTGKTGWSPLLLHARVVLGGRHGAGPDVIESWPPKKWWLVLLSLIIPWLLSTAFNAIKTSRS